MVWHQHSIKTDERPVLAKKYLRLPIYPACQTGVRRSRIIVLGELTRTDECKEGTGRGWRLLIQYTLLMSPVHACGSIQVHKQ